MRTVFELAHRLGWTDIVRHEYWYDEQAIVWYDDGDMDDDVLFQINTQPSLRAAIFSSRFHIFVGWILIPSPFELDEQVARLTPYLARSNFETTSARRNFLEAYPQFERLRRKDFDPDTVFPLD